MKFVLIAKQYPANVFPAIQHTISTIILVTNHVPIQPMKIIHYQLNVLIAIIYAQFVL